MRLSSFSTSVSLTATSTFTDIPDMSSHTGTSTCKLKTVFDKHCKNCETKNKVLQSVHLNLRTFTMINSIFL